MSDELKRLHVLLHNQPVGAITHLGQERSLFTFTESYIDAYGDPATRKTLSLGFKNALGQLITNFQPTQKTLLPFFSNLLPEDAMRQFLAERAGINPTDEFALLAALGGNLPGAVTITSAEENAIQPVFGNSSNNTNTNANTSPTENAAENNQDNKKGVYRFSLAGVQLKFPAFKQASGRFAISTQGLNGSWIVKFPSGQYPGIAENEFSMMTLAKSIGINVPEIELLDIDDIDNLPQNFLSNFLPQETKTQKGLKALAIKRFDRAEDGSAIHCEDFAQIFGVHPQSKQKNASLRHIAEVIGIEGKEEDTKEFVRRVMFNMLIGNADIRLKNWSLLYSDGKTPSIAPAYDLVSTIPYLPYDAVALKISRSKKYSDFSMDELSHLAATARLPEKLVLDTAEETATLFQQHWQQEKNNLALNREVIGAIDKHLGQNM